MNTHPEGKQKSARVAGYEIVCLSDTGKVRSGNEDAVTAEPTLGLAILADGMGGYAAGEVASKLAVDEVLSELTSALPHLLLKSGPDLDRSMVEDLRFAASRANESIVKLAGREIDYEGMGSTLVIAVLSADRIHIGHLGDSRAYRFAAGQIQQLTRDHCWIDEQIEAGNLSAEALADPRYKNIVTRALGIEDEVDLEVHEHSAAPDDIFLLCSDGLTDMVSDTEMASILALKESLTARAQRLIDTANENGGKDNVSVILMRAAADPPMGWAARLIRRLHRDSHS